MTKTELVARLAKQRPHLRPQDVERVVGVFFEQISSALEQGCRVELRGFCSFGLKSRKARNVRNPMTGARLTLLARKVVVVKTGRPMRNRLNSKPM